MYDLSIVKNLLRKDVYRSYRSFVKETELGAELRPILRAVDVWYQNNTEEPTLEDVANLTFAAGVPEKEKEFTKQLFNSLAAVNGTETVIQLLERFKTNSLCQQISLAAYEASEGRKDFSDVLLLTEQLRSPVVIDDIDYVTDDLHVLLQETLLSPGLRWRSKSLNRALGSLRQGNFGFVFARPETGKTTLLTSEVSHMVTMIPPDKGPAIFFNNEEKGEYIQNRFYQSVLGCTTDELIKNPDKSMQKYRDIVKGKFLLYDSASLHKKKIEAICEKEKPSLIVFNDIDKIKGFKADRDDLMLGAIYQWSRELAKAYGPVIGVCQADASAEGVDWLYMDNVANAKTAKQAEADFILGIGKKHEDGFQNVRFINVCKNKLSGDPDTDRTNRHPKINMRIVPEIARYEDL